MKHLAIALFCVLIMTGISAQNADTNDMLKRIEILENENAKLQREISSFRQKTNNMEAVLETHVYAYDEIKTSMGSAKSDKDKIIDSLNAKVTTLSAHNHKLMARMEFTIIFFVIACLFLVIVSVSFLFMSARKFKKFKHALFYRIVLETDQLRSEIFEMVSRNSEDMKLLFASDLNQIRTKIDQDIAASRTELTSDIETISKDMRDDLMHITNEFKRRIDKEVLTHNEDIDKLWQELKHL